MNVITARLPIKRTQYVHVVIGEGMWLGAEVSVPPEAKGVVLCGSASGSERHNPRNQYVARELNEHHLATVLADLLSAGEERVDGETLSLRFNVRLLTRRMEMVIDWARCNDELASLPVSLFGSGACAAAALNAAAARPDIVRFVVSRSGRPDLATALDHVIAPTLFIAAEGDPDVVNLNRTAMREMRCVNRLEILPGTTDLFDEQPALERATVLAAEWLGKQFDRCVKQPRSAAGSHRVSV